MKKFVSALFALMIGSSLTLAAPQVYNDALGDLNDGTVGDDLTGHTHLDIDEVTMDSDALNLYITISVDSGDILSPGDWGNYMIAIDSGAGGDTAGNGWARPISYSDNGGMDSWIGAWVNGGGGGQVWNYGGAWSEDAAAVAVVTTELSLTVALADLGLSAGQTFSFDVYSSGGGGGDSAVDALSSPTPSITGWGGPYDTGANGLQYTVVPEPASIALIFGAGILAIFRRRK